MNVTFKRDNNDQMLLAPLAPDSDWHCRVLSGHLLGQAVKTVEFQALTGPAVIDFLIATRLA